MTNVTVEHIFQFQNGAFGSCQTGRAIRADNSGTVTITNTTVKDYQKSGFEARGLDDHERVRQHRRARRIRWRD